MLRSSHDACGCSTQTTSSINLKRSTLHPHEGQADRPNTPSDSVYLGSNPGPPATKPLDTAAFCQFSFASKFVRHVRRLRVGSRQPELKTGLWIKKPLESKALTTADSTKLHSPYPWHLHRCNRNTEPARKQAACPETDCSQADSRLAANFPGFSVKIAQTKEDALAIPTQQTTSASQVLADAGCSTVAAALRRRVCI